MGSEYPINILFDSEEKSLLYTSMLNTHIWENVLSYKANYCAVLTVFTVPQICPAGQTLRTSTSALAWIWNLGRKNLSRTWKWPCTRLATLLVSLQPCGDVKGLAPKILICLMLPKTTVNIPVCVSVPCLQPEWSSPSKPSIVDYSLCRLLDAKQKGWETTASSTDEFSSDILAICCYIEISIVHSTRHILNSDNIT